MTMPPKINTPHEAPESVVARVVRKLQEAYPSMSPAEVLSTPELISREERQAWLQSLTPEQHRILEKDWNFWARPSQREPKGYWKTWLVCAGRGFGKLERVSSVVPTLNGWKAMGELEPGDIIYDEKGNFTSIINVYPQGVKQLYRVKFSDGTSVDAGAEHLWTTWDHASRKAYLRSAHEPDTSQFPEDWYNWRPLRTNSGTRLPAAKVDAVVELVAAGASWRSASAQVGVCRAAVAHAARDSSYFDPKILYRDTDGVGPRVRTTQEIIDTLTYNKRGDLNHCIPVCGPLTGTHVDLPIDPYLLGYWLGDGYSTGDAFSCGTADVDWLLPLLRRQFSTAYTQIEPNRPTVACVRVPGLRQCLQRLAMVGHKHIPVYMLRMAADQRLALLQGLMDSDGHSASSGSSVEFSNTNDSIAAGVEELARSLGQKPHSEHSQSFLYGVRKRDKTRITWKPTIDVFRLPRKKDRVKFEGGQQLRNHHRMITDVEKIDCDEAVCIEVDSPSALYLTGRGMIPTHNTRLAAEWVRSRLERANRNTPEHIALVGPTAGDVRKVMVEDVYSAGSGLMQIFPDDNRPDYQPSIKRLSWLNPKYNSYGSTCSLYSGDEPELLRGPAHTAAWVDEIMRMKKQDAVWDMLQMGLRMGLNPQCVVSTTPKPTELMERLLKMPYTVITRGSTFENRRNLATDYIDKLLTDYEGTTIGRQELYAEILGAIEGALWTRQIIDDYRVKPDETGMYPLPSLGRTVIGVDPQTGLTMEDSAKVSMTGIVVVSGTLAVRSVPLHAYVRADLSMNARPEQWGRAVCDAYKEYNANLVVLEGNQGGQMASYVIRSINPNVRILVVTAKTKKHERAVPVVSRYQQGRVHHVGVFPELEREMFTYVPGDENLKKSPNRMDACVWAVRHLLVEEMRAGAGISITRRI